MASIRVTNATNMCQLCRVVDLTTELRPTRQFHLPVPVCNPCWPKERRLLARERAHRRARKRASSRASRYRKPMPGLRKALARDRRRAKAANPHKLHGGSLRRIYPDVIRKVNHRRRSRRPN